MNMHVDVPANNAPVDFMVARADERGRLVEFWQAPDLDRATFAAEALAADRPGYQYRVYSFSLAV